MQPYFFPYIGYFQLIHVVDKFIFYDDVNFIKQGWINRNKFLVNGNELIFSIPIKNISPNKKINETEISHINFDKWLSKFLKTLYINYSKAPYFDKVISIIENVMNEKHYFISSLAISSILKVCEYLAINDKIFEISSKMYSDSSNLHKSERLINICKKNAAKEYINPIGGKDLYTKEEFLKNNIELRFISTKSIRYNQFDNEFIQNLSIIDVMMFNSKKEIKRMLNEYELL